MDRIDPQIVIAAITAITAIMLAFFKMLGEIRETHRLVNSRMTELLELTRVAALASGRLAGEEIRQNRLDVPGVVDIPKDAAHGHSQESLG